MVQEILKVIDADKWQHDDSHQAAPKYLIILIANWKQVKTPAVTYSRASASSRGNHVLRVEVGRWL